MQSIFAKTCAKTFTKVSVFEESFGFRRKLWFSKKATADEEVKV
jgi:hypothetical protein